MSFEIQRIYLEKPNPENQYVTFENQLQTREIFDDALEILFRTHEKELLDIVEKELSAYLNCDDLCNDEEDMFPRRNILTGEWYVREINFEKADYLSIQTAFLGTDLGYKDDYLGLEVIFDYNEATDRFMFDGINSENL